MKEEEVVTGIILYTTLVGEYDKRLVILTKERGKITVFANGARRANSTLRAASQSFVMGKFTVSAGRDAYNLVRADVDEYFSEFAYDMERMCYASYFCELMSYYTREGDFCKNNLNLLYVTFRALLSKSVPVKLIRNIYEIKLMDLEGQGIHSFDCVKCGKKEELSYFDAGCGGLLCPKCALENKVTKKVSPTLVYTLQYILSSPMNQLYHFSLKEDSMRELEEVTGRFLREYVEKEFKSLEILSTLS